MKTQILIRIATALVPAAVVLLAGCVQKPEEMTATTLGSQVIVADTTLADLIWQEEEIFERTYKYANLEIHYLNETDMFDRFLNDTIKTIIATRQLSAGERAFLRTSQQITNPREFPFATSAIAFIAGRAARDTALVYEELVASLRDTASGKVFVIEDARSGIGAAMLNLTGLEKLPPHIYALRNKDDVLAYVNRDDRAIGIIDYSAISDSDEPYTKRVLAEATLLGISRPADSTQFGFVRPYQYNLQDRKYPFTRDLYVISKSGKTDVGIGFASFIAGEIGQKIILKAGLLPKYQSERVLEIGPVEDIKVVK